MKTRRFDYHCELSENIPVQPEHKRHRTVLKALDLLNILLVLLPFLFIWLFYYRNRMMTVYYRLGNYLVMALYAILYYLISHLYGGFTIQTSTISELTYSQTLACVITNFIIYIVMWLLMFRLPNPLYLLGAMGAQVILVFLWTFFTHRWYFRTFKPKETVVIYDEMEGMSRLVSEYGLETHYHIFKSLNVREIFPVENIQQGSQMEKDGDGRNSLRDERIARAVDGAADVFLCGLHSHERNQIVKYCVAHRIVSFTIPRIGDVIMSGAERIHFMHLPMLRIQYYQPSPEYLFLKRFFDVFLSGISLILLSPLMLILTLAVRSDGGNALYRQVRLTKDGRLFEILKFRSMKMNAESDGVARLSTGEEDPRVTRVGRILRKYRLDELPQLINILKGDMSIVGPRPERPEIAEQYKKALPEFDLRLQCKCGLTGYAQVYGQYNTTPYDKLLMDLMYISKPSLAEDFKICLATFKILFQKESTEGIAEGQTTAAESNENLQEDEG